MIVAKSPIQGSARNVQKISHELDRRTAIAIFARIGRYKRLYG
ncbi:MAG: hypothetical protein RQ754_05040 [Desulfuromonadales bacterium]|nr:hypothetical protein [Desulfuromonadales bacterium]